MPIAHFQKSRSELISLRILVETSCPSIEELTQIKAGLKPTDIFLREKTILIDCAIYTQKKAQQTG